MKQSSRIKSENPDEQQQNPKNIDINLTFGDNTDQKKLIEVDLKFEVGIISFPLNSYMINHKNAQENDLFFMVKFYVTPGREKQATQYLQKGMDEPQEQQSLNPIQKWLVRPKSAGRVYFETQQGVVIVYYCIYDEYAIKDESAKQVLELVKTEDHRPKIEFNFYLRGEQNKSIKDRTTIYPNYCQLNFKVQNLSFQKVGQIFKQMQLVPPELTEFPLYRMVTSGLRKIRLKSNLATFRKISSMYKQLAMIQQAKNPDLYIHKNLLRNKIQVLFSWGRLGVAQCQIKFQSEDHIQRLTSIMIKLKDVV